MTKADHRRELKPLYSAPATRPVTVEVPPFKYLMADGAGAPGGAEYANAIASLYPVAYTLKFMVRRGPLELDYRVMPLEGLWWANDMTAFTEDRRAEWKWTLMIMQPPCIAAGMVEEAIAEVRKKNAPALERVRFEAFAEGLCARILHKGPFSNEGPTIEKLQEYIEAEGKNLSGKHHEIYLSDMRRTAAANLKTIIRQPMR